MLLPKFQYHRPADLSEALAALSEYGPEAAVLAGGTDLLVKMKNKLATPKHLVALDIVEGLDEVAVANGDLRIGPMLTAADLAQSQALEGSAAALALGAGSLGSPQVRNRATVGGNVCNARPAADMCVPLLALGAKALLTNSGGERQVPLAEFFTGPGETVRRPDELLTALLLDKPSPGSGAGYAKLGLRKALEIALVNVAAVLSLDSDGKTIKEASVSLGAVAPTPILSPKAAEVLLGQAGGEKLFAAAGEAAAGDCRPITDHRGSAEYRREMVKVLTRRALHQAWQAARGK
ncbi:MAG: xanthine dehydrogenase family protein subunit M [Desulfarculaceae bacterium]|jgi:carbon-monoxide dehydrogenase medium subunit